MAVDEEMMASQFGWYSPFPDLIHEIVDAKTYAIRQVLRGTWQFYVQFGFTYRVVAVWEWKSSDWLRTTEEVLNECILQTGWKKPNGQYMSGNYIDNERRPIILIAFTKQELWDETVGLAYIRDENGLEPNAILISYYSTWADDNTIMHEVSHLHGCDDHQENEGCKHCVMEYHKEDVWWFNEPCMPIAKGHAILDLSMWSGYLRGGTLHYEWCDECKKKIEERSNPGCHFEGSAVEYRKDALFEPTTGVVVSSMPRIEPIKPIGILRAIGSLLLCCGIFALLCYALTRLLNYLTGDKKNG